jgi:hypothetical protein
MQGADQGRAEKCVMIVMIVIYDENQGEQDVLCVMRYNWVLIDGWSKGGIHSVVQMENKSPARIRAPRTKDKMKG